MENSLDSASRIGWIGCGRMGLALVTRLVDAGLDVSVYNRTKSKVESLAQRGVRVVDRPVDFADRDIVFTTVSGPADLAQVTTGPDGVLSGPTAPRVLVDVSTVSAEASRAVREAAAQRGTDFLAAPVSGNGKVVAAGGAVFAVSGPQEAFARVSGVLGRLGSAVLYVGDGERARLVKLAHNLFLGAVIQSLVETTLLIEQAGIARADYLAFVNQGALGSPFSRYKTPALVNLKWTPTFTLPLLAKDLDLGLEAARDHNVELPVTQRVRELVQQGIDAGHLEDDFAVLLAVQAAEQNIELVPDGRPTSDGLAK